MSVGFRCERRAVFIILLPYMKGGGGDKGRLGSGLRVVRLSPCHPGTLDDGEVGEASGL